MPISRGTARTLRDHRAAIDPVVANHGGRIVKTTGDGILLEFPSIVAAVECAIAVQKLMARRNTNVPIDRRMPVTTVRHWCDDVAADVGRHGGAAIVYDGMFTDEERRGFSALPSDQARRSLALKSLAGFVLANFPRGFSEP